MSAITKQINGFQVSAWSVSGLETCVVVRRGALALCFDLGIAIAESVACAHVFISHGHIDHIGALAQHARKRQLQRLSPATYYMPRALVEPVRQICNQFAEMHGEGAESLRELSLVPLDVGQRFELPGGRFIETFATVHRVTSLGFLVYRRARKRPFEEEPAASRDAVHPEIAYLGDTAFSVFLSPPNDDLLRVELLITEVTYIDRPEDRGPDNPGFVTRARLYGHTHLAELCEHAGQFANVEHILLVHFSDRYSPQMIEERLRRTLPPSLRTKVTPATWAKAAMRLK